jgi:hypothetical protein
VIGVKLLPIRVSCKPIEKFLPTDARQPGKLGRASPLCGAKSRLSHLESQ